MIETGKYYLVTVDNWFIAPDGEQYRAVYGKVEGVFSDEDTLGIKTNRGSTNWYLKIGNMIVAGCQIHHAIRSDECSENPTEKEIEHEGELKRCKEKSSKIYFS